MDALQDAGRIVAPWHSVLRRLVEAVDQASLTAVPLHTSLPVDSWPTSRVTLLGDAIHTMTPLQGLGDNTGDRRRAAPPHQLSEANRGEKPLLSPVAEYEQAMRRGGFEAVAQVTAGLQRGGLAQSCGATRLPRDVARLRTGFRGFAARCSNALSRDFPAIRRGCGRGSPS